MKHKILIIDDEKNIRDIFSLLLEEKKYLVETAENGEEGLKKNLIFNPDVILLDMNMPDFSGIEILGKIKEKTPTAEVIIITAFGTIQNAVEATKLGAYDYLEKPVHNDELLLSISRAIEVKRLRREVRELKSELSARYRFSSIIGTSAKMNSIFQMMEKVAQVDGTVLITGESGTGKELIARAIHFKSPRKDEPFVVVNCGAIPNDLIESEFFGHTKGAFTDAKTEKTGKFELANNGTIFLDEVGELSQNAQVKLLRVLGEREIVRVGGVETFPINVRVIAATNRVLEDAVKDGVFREDLYWRLAVLSIHVPPLRERKEDILLLCDHFIKKFNKELGKEIKGVTPGTLNLLKNYDWPGNIREMESVIYETLVMSEYSQIEEENMPLRIRVRAVDKKNQFFGKGRPMNQLIQNITEKNEKSFIEDALQESGGNRTKAAQILGISRKTLFNKMVQYKIQ
ncbi:sigma-54-dependent transcriptional regulator [Acidobacteriota bacterium]